MTAVSPQLVELLEPIAPPEGPELRMAPRPASLAGKVLALFDDNEPNAREILEDFAELIAARHRIAGVRYRNLNNGTGYDVFGGKRVDAPDQTLEATASQSDVAIVGVGH